MDSSCDCLDCKYDCCDCKCDKFFDCKENCFESECGSCSCERNWLNCRCNLSCFQSRLDLCGSLQEFLGSFLNNFCDIYIASVCSSSNSSERSSKDFCPWLRGRISRMIGLSSYFVKGTDTVVLNSSSGLGKDNCIQSDEIKILSPENDKQLESFEENVIQELPRANMM